MDTTELVLEQIEVNGKVMVVLTANGIAVVGVDTVQMGADQSGPYMDLRMRKFRLGTGPVVPEPVLGGDVENGEPPTEQVIP